MMVNVPTGRLSPHTSTMKWKYRVVRAQQFVQVTWRQRLAFGGATKQNRSTNYRVNLNWPGSNGLTWRLGSTYCSAAVRVMTHRRLARVVLPEQQHLRLRLQIRVGHDVMMKLQNKNKNNREGGKQKINGVHVPLAVSLS